MTTRRVTIITFLLFVSGIVTAQCHSDDYLNSSVSEIPSGYNFIKSYKVEGENDLEKIEFSYVLTKGTQYVLTLREGNKVAGTIVTLYDNQRHRIASNKIGDMIVQAVAFPCQASGIYYIQYTFTKGSLRCAGSALGFKR